MFLRVSRRDPGCVPVVGLISLALWADPGRPVHHDAEQVRDRARFVADGLEAGRPPHVLGQIVPRPDQRELVDPRGLAGEYPFHEGFDLPSVDRP